MAIREIRKHKDEVLYKRCKEIDVIDDRIKELAGDMLDTMYKYDGIGLAACQVGILKRMIVYDIDYFEENGKKNPKVLVNPVITKFSKTMVTTEEGCLSFPDMFGYVDRPDKVTVEGYDLDNNKVVIHAKDLLAVVLQHETDHLNGKVFLDKAYDTYVGQRPEEKKKCKKRRIK